MVNLNCEKCIPLKYTLKKSLIFLLFSPSSLFLCYIFSYRNFLRLLRPLIMVISKTGYKTYLGLYFKHYFPHNEHEDPIFQSFL